MSFKLFQTYNFSLVASSESQTSLSWGIFPDYSNMATINQGANYKKILRLSYDVIITYDNRKSNLQ